MVTCNPRAGERVRASIHPAKRTSTPVAQFIPVEIVGEPTKSARASSTSTMEIALRRHRRIRVGVNFDAHLLARLVKVLETIP